jgi:hypothetical protein
MGDETGLERIVKDAVRERGLSVNSLEQKLPRTHTRQWSINGF